MSEHLRGNRETIIHHVQEHLAELATWRSTHTRHSNHRFFRPDLEDVEHEDQQ